MEPPLSYNLTIKNAVVINLEEEITTGKPYSLLLSN